MQSQYQPADREAVRDDVSQKDIVKVAVGSPGILPHWFAALKQAEYVDDISNAGPFTVLHTNDAFASTCRNGGRSYEADQKMALKHIEYHVAVGGYKAG
ncbi:MAG: hypothetical protein IPI30_22340 [Saprospiraceae bacterium]|nr:hypothetical protein [Candidatus Vicinibacter affinis]